MRLTGIQRHALRYAKRAPLTWHEGAGTYVPACWMGEPIRIITKKTVTHLRRRKYLRQGFVPKMLVITFDGRLALEKMK